MPVNPPPMPSNQVNNHGSGPQNVATGSGSQCNQNGNGPQLNHCIVNGDYLSSLTFGEFDARYRDIAEAHPDTCGWLFETSEFQQWRDPAYRDVHNGVLWIKGKPGSGKSTLMKHAYIRYQDEFFHDHLIVPYFFNARGETLEKTPLGLLRSMVYYLLKDDDEIYEGFAHFFRNKQRPSHQADWQWSLPELQNFVHSVVKRPRSRPLLIVIDALDECTESHVRDVVRFLESLSIQAVNSRVPLQICLSSRHYPKVGMNKVIELEVERSEDHQTDIAKYIDDTLTKHEDSAKMEAEIVRKANSVFLWVVIVVSMLNKAYDEGQVEAMQQALEEIPAGLEEVFSAIVSNVADETVLMLQWVLLSRQPLSPEELCAAVGARLTNFELISRRITASSKGLIEIRRQSTTFYRARGEERQSVQFIHLSVRDFLFRQKRLQKLDPQLGSEPVAASNYRLWACCRSYIERMDTTRMSEQHMREMRDQNPFLEHAATYIFDYAERALSGEVIMQDGGSEREARPETLDTSQWKLIEQWLQDQDRWLQWLAMFRDIHEDPMSHYEHRSEAGAGLLYVLARRGLSNLLAIVVVGADINAQGGYYGNALQAGSMSGNREVVRLLLHNGADVNIQGRSYSNALQTALSHGHREIVQLFLENGADIHAQGGEYVTAFEGAFAQAKQETVQLLPQNGADEHHREPSPS